MRRAAGDREVLVPFVKAIVPEVDVAGGRVIVTPPAGLFEDLPAEDGDEPDDCRRRGVRSCRGRSRRGLTCASTSSRSSRRSSTSSRSRCWARRAAAALLDVRVHDLRDWTHDRHRTVDDTPYGGGAGMVMKPEPWGEALDAIAADAADRLGGSSPVFIFPSPAGELFTQATARELAQRERTWCSAAAATRASTSACSRTRRRSARCGS